MIEEEEALFGGFNLVSDYMILIVDQQLWPVDGREAKLR